jgi:hypothetical protein
VIPKAAVAGQPFERLQKGLDVLRRMFLPQGRLRRFQEVSKANPVLLLFRAMAMRLQVERNAGRLMRKKIDVAIRYA